MRPSQSRSVATVESIVGAATDLLATSRPYTTNHIANAAGVNVATLYRYFANKEAVLDAVALRFAASVDSKLELAFEQALRESPADGVGRLVALLHDALRAHPRLVQGPERVGVHGKSRESVGGCFSREAKRW